MCRKAVGCWLALTLVVVSGIRAEETVSPLKELEWLIGSWQATFTVPEAFVEIPGAGKEVTSFSRYEWMGGKNYIRCIFQDVADGKVINSGEEIIAGDPESGITHEIFGTGGLHGPGKWQKKQDGVWELHWEVANSQRKYTGTSIHRPQGKNAYKWQMVNLKRDGEDQPNWPVVTFRRTSGEDSFRSWAKFMVGGVWTNTDDEGNLHEHAYRWTPDKRLIELVVLAGPLPSPSRAIKVGVDPLTGRHTWWTFGNNGGTQATFDRVGENEWLIRGSRRDQESGEIETGVWKAIKVGSDQLQLAFIPRGDDKLRKFTWIRKKMPEAPVQSQLKDLECFTGDWQATATLPKESAPSDKLGELGGKAVTLSMSVRWAPGKCAQLVDVDWYVPDLVRIKGTAVRAWDQDSKQIREHLFTTHKGTWTGSWKQNGETWVHSYRGHDLDGKVGTGKQTCTFRSADEFVLTETNRTLDGKPQPDMKWTFKRNGQR